ncbi:MAG: Hpt domain-containing protein, partial [Gammaproteobacteria bacterium]|nr:Hpt domain-containing protein [Gammaproteobacteria bacterium]
MNPDTSQVDLNTLQWVKSEIDETLKQARIALEQHVESPEGDSHLQLVVNYLHQVRGTLQMVELYGAAMLSEELEKLTQALLDKEVEGRDDIYEVMIRAMWQLPDYLERLQSGHKDIPMVLLPLLNDLRASRRAPLLTESALFTPDLDVDVPVSAESHGDENLPALAKKLRHTYHLGLLDWYREKDSAGGLKKLDNVIEKLRHAANDQEVNRVLWSASGVVEALREGGIEPSVAVKLLMGRLDREIKKIIDQGETVLQNERPADLEKNLLYYVASSSSDGEKVKSLKKTFKLAEALPDEATLERARADLTGPNAELLQTVSKVLLENMLQVKDQLDVFVRSDERDPAKLPAMCDSLVQTADTLGMLGFGKQRQIVMEQKDILESISNGTQSLDENILLDVAHALLSIENLLQGAKSGKTEININADDHAEKAEEAARQELLESVMAEARKNMGKVKEAMGAFLETPRNFTLISEVPDLLDQIRGSFNILGLDRPAQLVNTSCTYIQKEMIDARRSPDPASADALADALSSIEYYMDSMAGKWGNPNSILEVAEQRLAQMGLGEHIKPLHEGVAAVHAAEEVTESELSLNELTDEIELAGLVDSDEDTMIDLNATDGISAELHISTDDDTQNGLTVESADSSTAEISFDEMQEALESRGLSPDADTQNDTQEIDISGLMSVEDMTDEIDLSMTPVPTPVNEIDLSDLELPESDEIDISGLELIDIDAPEKKTHSELNEDESSQEISFHINAPDLADEEEESTSIDVLEIDDERFTIPADLDLEEPEATPNTTTQEIELDISQLDLPADDVADILNDAEIDNAPESDSEDTDISNRTQEIDISEYEIADGGQDLDNAPANIELSSEAADDNRSNDTQEIDFDSSIIEVIENPKLPEPLPVRQPQVGLSAKDIPELTSRLEAWYEDTRNEVLTKKLRRSITDIKKQAKQLGREDVAKVANDMAALFKSVNKGEMRLTEEVKNSLSFAIDTLSEVLPAEPPRAVVTPLQSSPIPTAPPKAYEVAEEIDEDIIEIFLEEAAEALEHIDQRLSDWRNNPDDEESLRELRRAFHTLKGSGRLVGASEAGEFAWAFENMLNRVIDRTIDSGPLIHDMVQQARDALPDLLELFRTGGRAGNEIFQLMEQADAISRGTVTASDLAVPTTTAGDVPDLSSLSGEYDMAMDEEPVPVPRSADLVPEIDETLLGIYRKETANHLDDLREYLHDWRSGKDRTANHNLVRALHTLKGSSRTAGVTGVAELCHRFEKLANEMSNHEIEVSDSMLDLLDRSINFVDETVSILDQPGAPLPDNSGLIEALSEQEQSISQGISSLVKLQLTPENDDNQDSSASLQSEYDTELLQIFIEEGDEILEESDQTLHNWAGDRTNDEYVEALQRQLHTLKGSARMAGVTVIGDLSHAIESMITAMVEGRIAAVDEVYDVLQYAQDKLVNMLEQLKSGQPLTPESDFINAVEQLTGTGVV